MKSKIGGNAFGILGGNWVVKCYVDVKGVKNRKDAREILQHLKYTIKSEIEDLEYRMGATK